MVRKMPPLNLVSVEQMKIIKITGTLPLLLQEQIQKQKTTRKKIDSIM